MRSLAIALCLLCSPAFAGQIDYVLKFADETAAKTALASRTRLDEKGIAQWPQEYCIPNVQLWRDSQDIHTQVPSGNTTTDPDTGVVTDIMVDQVTHVYLPGFYILCSLDRVVPAFRDLAAVQVVLDRDLAKARRAGAVIKSNVSNAILQDIRFSPVFAGSDIPYGNMK